MDRIQKRTLFSLYLAYFADYFSWGAAVAYSYVYLTDARTPFTDSLWNNQASLAILLASFPFGEVIGSALLGDLSDSMGRKKILLGGLWGSIFSLCLCALSLSLGSIPLFIFGQFLSGFFSGKQAMAQAAIVETPGGTKGQKLAFLSVLGGIAWLLGPFLANLLIEEPFFGYGGFIWPSLIASGAFAITLLATQFLFKDTYEPPFPRPLSLGLFVNGIKDLGVAFWKDRIFILFLLNLLGWYLLAIALSDFLIVKFNLTQSQVGYFNNYLAVCFTIGGIVGTLWILRRWRAKNILFWSLLAGSIALGFCFGAERAAELWTYLAIPALTEAWIYPAYQTVLSDQTGKASQGKLFGFIGATNGACQYGAAVILTGISSQSSILIAALLFLASSAFLPIILKRKAKMA
jgi:MFS family permease